MANDTSNMKTATPGADYDAVVVQLAAMRGDMAKLAAAMSTLASHRGQAFAQDLSDGMTEAANYISRKGHDGDLRLEGAVAANPYIALGLAAGMGLLVGNLTRR